MNCHDCDKELSGGFGFGPKPYKKFRCFDCSLNSVKAQRRIHQLEQIEHLSGVECKLKGRHYKEYAVELEWLLDRIRAWAKED